jgi:hypothetical protein
MPSVQLRTAGARLSRRLAVLEGVPGARSAVVVVQYSGMSADEAVQRHLGISSQPGGTVFILPDNGRGPASQGQGQNY